MLENKEVTRQGFIFWCEKKTILIKKYPKTCFGITKLLQTYQHLFFIKIILKN